MTDSNRVLTLRIDGGDSVAISEPAANYTSATVGSTTTYTLYDDAAHTNQLAQLVVMA